VVTDDAGGVIVVWRDDRFPSAHLYAQRVDGFGNPLWVQDGIPVCPGSTGQTSAPQAIPDGTGGAIVVWEDTRTTHEVYAQRIDPDGNLLWNADGVLASTATGAKRVPQIAADGNGGVYIVWQDERNGNKDIYAQRLDANGSALWAADGVAACTDVNTQEAPEIAADIQGAYIVWKDLRSGNYDIYARRITALGTPSWTANGVAVCNATGTQEQPQIIPNGFGGAILVWRDLRTGSSGDIYYQLLNAGGTPIVTANGIVVSTSADDERRPQIVPDGNTAGCIITWENYTNGWDIYAQRMANSIPQWGPAGVVVCSVPYNEENPQLIATAVGGAIITWTDSRYSWEYDIYAQKLDGAGTALWQTNGVNLCKQPGNQLAPQITSDGAGGAIVCWYDLRNFTDYNVYAQRVEQNGYWGYPAPEISTVRDVPGDQGGTVRVTWNASRLDPLPDALITHYTVWRALSDTQVSAAMEAGASLLADVANLDAAQSGSVIRPADTGDPLASATYFWELVASVDAYHLDAYAKVVPTLFDSTLTTPDAQYVQVIAHTGDSRLFWVSPAASGHSVDNLAPAIPRGLAGEQVGGSGGLRLTWHPNAEPDLARYAVYRGTSPGFLPDVSNLLATLPDTLAVDGAWQWNSGYYYKVTAIDIHDNESLFALLGPDVATGAIGPLYTLSVHNFPNPFNPSTTVTYTVPFRGTVTVSIYDVRGACVATLVDNETREAGAYRVAWNGQTDSGVAVSSGIYFARIHHNDALRSNKMVLLK
jgi:hypothetical protein